VLYDEIPSCELPDPNRVELQLLEMKNQPEKNYIETRLALTVKFADKPSLLRAVARQVKGRSSRSSHMISRVERSTDRPIIKE